ncbi:ATP-binding protein [Litorivicinus lipolyticus]|uniref:sensor histidine kinase n=1 Tax=Litorivicinus lipolyticus TaxID=418701 RepID=UPI003B5B23B5
MTKLAVAVVTLLGLIFSASASPAAPMLIAYSEQVSVERPLLASFDRPIRGFANLGFRRGPVWFQVSGLASIDPDDAWLVMRPVYTDVVEVFVESPAGLASVAAFGDRLPSNYAVLGGYAVALSELQGADTAYVRIQSNNVMSVEFSLSSTAQLMADERTNASLIFSAILAALGFAIWAVVGRASLGSGLARWFVVRQFALAATVVVHSGLLATVSGTHGWVTQDSLHNWLAIGFVSIAQLFDARLIMACAPRRGIRWLLYGALALFGAKALVLAGGAVSASLLVNNFSVLLGLVLCLGLVIWPRKRDGENRVQPTYLRVYFGAQLVAPAMLTVAGIQDPGGLVMTSSVVSAIGLMHALVISLIALVIVRRKLHLDHQAVFRYRRLAHQVRRERDDISDLLAMLTHELKTPLATLKMLGADAEPAVRSAVAEIDSVARQCQVLAEVDRGLSNQTRAEHVDLAKLVKSAASRYLGDCPFEIRGRDDLVVYADSSLLRIVMNNLIANAVAYRAAGSVVSVELGAAPEGPTIRVSNLLRGSITVPITQLFEKYYRLPRDATTAGTGLGLYLVQRIARATGIAVAVTAEDEVFCVTLTVGAIRRDNAPAQLSARSEAISYGA